MDRVHLDCWGLIEGNFDFSFDDNINKLNINK